MKIYAKKILLTTGWTSDVTLDIENGVIADISNEKVAGAMVVEQPIVPGMVNLHSHSFQKAFVGLTEFKASQQDSFWSWRDAMYRLLQKVTPDDLKVISEYLYGEMLRHGYTSCAEFHYLHNQANGVPYDDPAACSHAIIQGAKASGILLRHCPVFYHYSGFGKKTHESGQKPFFNTVESFQRLLEVLQKDYQNDSQVEFGVAPHSLRAVSKQQLHELLDWWKSGPFHIHIAEQEKEVNECVSYYGKRPVEFLLQQGDIGEQWCFVHATHLTASETRDLAKSGVVAGLCPETEANLGDGIFPAIDYLSHSGRWGIGSDSHICISPWRELRTLEYSQRFLHRQRNLLAQSELPHVGRYLWETAAYNGSQVVHQQTGKLAIGQRADFITLNTELPELTGRDDDFLLDSAIFACNDNPVRDVMVAGQWRVQQGELLNQQDSAQKYRQVLKRLLEQ